MILQTHKVLWFGQLFSNYRGSALCVVVISGKSKVR